MLSFRFVALGNFELEAGMLSGEQVTLAAHCVILALSPPVIGPFRMCLVCDALSVEYPSYAYVLNIFMLAIAARAWCWYRHFSEPCSSGISIL